MRYPAVYSDSKGSEATFLDNDGEQLSIVIRGITFSGSSFDALEPDYNPVRLSEFLLNNYGELCACRIEFQVILPLVSDAEGTNGKLNLIILLGAPSESGGNQSEGLWLELSYRESHYRVVHAPECSKDFEDQFLALNRQLPPSVLPKCCFNCQYSDYGVAGHGYFGSMMCFRNIKKEYSQVKTKEKFMEIMDKFDRWVQEIYLCSDFQRRVPGTGYRG